MTRLHSYSAPSACPACRPSCDCDTTSPDRKGHNVITEANGINVRIDGSTVRIVGRSDDGDALVT